tara:strand:- start:8914 stop:9855 length:942 start_codon:yes stop_codon:yes gene_type:complete
MKILYLVDKHEYDTKMSRVRFHSMLAIGRQPDVELKWSGLNWPDYDMKLTVQENIDQICPNPDLVVAYKPLLLRDFDKVTAKTCVRYNEMYDLSWTVKEIENSNPNIIICHHENDKNRYEQLFPNRKFAYVGHCAEKIIYKDYGIEKKVDLLLVGAVGTTSILGQHYPLRIRLARDILPRINPKYRCVVLQHPGGVLYDAPSERNSFEFAQAISMAKICLTCSGLPKSKFGKYVEVPMCGTALAADLPDQEHSELRKFLIEISNEWTDEAIVKRLEKYLGDEKLLSKVTKAGLKYAQGFTQEKYAERFLEVVR